MTAVRAIRSDCAVPVFLFYFFLKASFYHSIDSADDSNSFFIRQIHFYGSPFHQCRQAVTSLKADQTVHRLFCLCLSPFPAGYLLSAFAGRGKDCGAFPSSFRVSISRMDINRRTAFPKQRSIHPRTAAQAYIVPSGYPLNRQYHVMAERTGNARLPNSYGNCYDLQPAETVWCCQAATTVLRRVIHNYFS